MMYARRAPISIGARTVSIRRTAFVSALLSLALAPVVFWIPMTSGLAPPGG